MTDRRGLTLAEIAVDACLLGVTWAFLFYYFKPSLLLLDTMVSGGDTPSFLGPIHHLRNVLLPAGNLQGWDLGNLGGYAPYQFYFLPPSLAVVALSIVLPLNVAFKLVTAAGTFLLPLTTMIALRMLGYASPVTGLGAVVTLTFLFNEGNSMWGGNIPSTLAGEFAHSLGFAFAVLFLGLFYRGITEGRGWRSRAIVLALAGLCHPVAFLNAAISGFYFVFDRDRFGRHVRYLLAVYGAAVLLMAFWLVPLIAKLGYATAINWKWIFQSWSELLPRILWPVAILAALDIVWMTVRPRPTDRPARYLLFGLVSAWVCFLNATAVGLPEIRFVPFIYFTAVLLAIDFQSRLLPTGGKGLLVALQLGVAIIFWVHSCTTFIPNWIRWNYEGAERKPSYPLLRSIADAVRGTIADPRVAYENSPLHDRFGSMRIFEDLPLLSGRATLEGVLLQTSVMSPYIYWLQSQISKQGTGVIPGYSYPSLDLSRATPRLQLLNVSHMIAVTPEVTTALDHDLRWERIFLSQPYAIFRLKNADPHYVRVPRFRPVLLPGRDWKMGFHRWFATDAALDVPVVAASHIPPGEDVRFPLVSDTPSDLPRESIEAGCRVSEQIDHLSIGFTTTCPGLPHLISISYSPNWHVEGARHVFLAGPAFMLVFPDAPSVRLTFRRIAVDWIGIMLSAIGLILCLTPVPRLLAILCPMEWLPSCPRAVQRYLMTSTLTVIILVTAWNAARDRGPALLYQRGWTAFEKQAYVAAQQYFEWAILLGGRSSTAADATFFRAASLLRAGNPAEALTGYRMVIDRYPDSVWVAESHYHIGLCLRQLGRLDEARDKFRYVIDTFPGNRWTCFADEQLRELNGQPRRKVPCL